MTKPPPSPDAAGHVANPRHYRYYDFCMVGFVTVLLCSNLIGPGKTSILAGIPFSAGNLFFPISYIFGDVLTEVYGFARARKVIWAGFGAMLFATVMGQFIIHAPLDPSEPYNAIIQPALEVVFGNTWRIMLASLVAFWVGDFVNSYVLARMKVWTRGRHLWTRTIGSTFVGQLVDTAVFYPIAFAGLWKTDTLVWLAAASWAFKVGVEVVCTPVTYLVVGWLKRVEREDYLDEHTSFTPFSLKD
ncbi:MAG TPA: queuosine precursor transporter [Kofleriaceae bacterium]|nr:queuosine precursor transporter [Kofleriaceae bacterium]